MDADFANVDHIRTQIESGRMVPREMAIETVFGCNASCRMCFIDQETDRHKRVMKMDLYRYIIDFMEPYKDNLQRFDLWALGEPMIDPHIVERVAYAKRKGYKRMAISTNADLLTEERARGLLDAGIDTMLLSIDGTRKETHETIRPGTTFERVVENCERMIRLRDEGDYGTRFIVRLIHQDLNQDQWPEFRDYWTSRLSFDRRDNVALYHEHNYGGFTGDKRTMVGEKFCDKVEAQPCRYVFESLIILSDGRLSLCPADFLKAEFRLGKLPEQTPLEGFNSPAYQEMREKHIAGRKNDVKLCNDCTILYSMNTREFVWEQRPNETVPRQAAE